MREKLNRLCGKCELWIVALVCFLAPIIEEGVILNDEVQMRLLRQQGIRSFIYNTVVNEQLAKGRVLGTIGNLKLVGYISDNKYIFRSIQCVFLVVAIVLFAFLIYRLFGSKKLTLITALMIMSFMPITFEHSAPNAFIIVCTEPMIWLLISLLLFCKYMGSEKRSHIVLSMLFFMWGMFLYEFIITYAPLYLIIYIGRKLDKRIDFRDMFRCLCPVIVTSILYLSLYVLQGSLFPTNYSGNTIGEISIKSICSVIWPLFLSALPGYFAFASPKYKYLYSIYSQGRINWIAVIFCVVLVIIMFRLCKCSEKVSSSGYKRNLFVIISALSYAFIPSLPNAITPMYQAVVPSGDFISIPVSIYLFFAVSFLMAFMLCLLLERSKRELVKVAVLLFFSVLAFNVQDHNYTFAQVHAENYDRFEGIENLFSMDYWKQLDGITILSPSVYETRNTLAIEAGHWTEYAKLHGNNITVINDGEEKDGYFQFDYNNCSVLSLDSGNIVFSRHRLTGNSIVTSADEKGNTSIYTIEDNIWYENGYFVYEAEKKDISA